MSTRAVLEIFGWISSGLIVLSLAQARVWRFRIMNFAGAALGTMYNALLGIWPFAAMNAVITVIDAYWMVRLSREGRPATYDLLRVDHDDPYVQHFLKIHAKGTRSHFPHFDPQAPTRATVLVLRGDETVGVVAISDTTDRTAHVSLDYVTDRFRDYTPATYVYEDSGLFERLGVEHIQVPGTADHKYLRRMGFRPHEDEWVREVRV
jgi:hypothetical protein